MNAGYSLFVQVWLRQKTLSRHPDSFSRVSLSICSFPV
jgi:hypothetical protein